MNFCFGHFYVPGNLQVYLQYETTKVVVYWEYTSKYIKYLTSKL